MESFASTQILFLLGLGFLLGLKHALDIDHIVTVSMIVSEKKGLLRSIVVGITWGLGHTGALLVVGIVVLFFNIHIPDVVIPWIELAVALVLIILGIRLLIKIRHGAVLHMHVHQHQHHFHLHPHIHETLDEHRHEDSNHHTVAVNRKPFFIGILHGLAGSGALMIVILTSIPSRLIGILYITVFGFGSVIGMALISMALNIPFSLATKHPKVMKSIQASAALLSILVGIGLTAQIVFAPITQ
jgi:high-affinity nickel permease